MLVQTELKPAASRYAGCFPYSHTRHREVRQNTLLPILPEFLRLDCVPHSYNSQRKHSSARLLPCLSPTAVWCHLQTKPSRTSPVMTTPSSFTCTPAPARTTQTRNTVRLQIQTELCCHTVRQRETEGSAPFQR